MWTGILNPLKIRSKSFFRRAEARAGLGAARLVVGDAFGVDCRLGIRPYPPDRAPMIIQQRLTSRSSRSLAVMIGFAQPAGSRGTWRSDGDIDSGGRPSALAPRSSAALSPHLPSPFAATGTGHSTRCALGRP